MPVGMQEYIFRFQYDQVDHMMMSGSNQSCHPIHHSHDHVRSLLVCCILHQNDVMPNGRSRISAL
jgi:hypothetical protein